MRKLVASITVIAFAGLMLMGGVAIASHPHSVSDQFIHNAVIFQAANF